jgi:hypothetical protein
MAEEDAKIDRLRREALIDRDRTRIVDEDLQRWMLAANVAYIIDQLRRGNAPPARYLAAAMLIYDWSSMVLRADEGEGRPRLIIVGRLKPRPVRHVGFRTKPPPVAGSDMARTMRVRWIDARRRWCIDEAGLWRLGDPAPEEQSC